MAPLSADRFVQVVMLGVLVCAAPQTCAQGSAQSFPTHPITMIFPTAPGTATEQLYRTIAAEAAKSLGQPIIVENRNGAAGRLGLNALPAARGDGHVLTMATSANLVVQPLANPAFKSTLWQDYSPLQIT